jgi:acyl transferase domain-containing protein
LRERTLPPSLHFETPNPRLELDSSPFFVPTRAQPWTADGPRRAGVSSFGIGGTNAHVILQEAPAPSSPAPSRPTSLLLLSARTSDGLEAMRHNLAQHLETHPDLGLADVSYTLAVGRRAFSCRCAAACSTREEAIAWLRAPAPKTVGSTELRTRRPIFLFPGQGSQSAFMGAELYEAEPVFRATIDACAAILSTAAASIFRRRFASPTGALTTRNSRSRRCSPRTMLSPRCCNLGESNRRR